MMIIAYPAKMDQLCQAQLALAIRIELHIHPKIHAEPQQLHVQVLIIVRPAFLIPLHIAYLVIQEQLYLVPLVLAIKD